MICVGLEFTMTKVVFTSALQRHIQCSECEVEGATAKDVLRAVFDQFPSLKSYVVDEQGKLRHHVVVFINGDAVLDRKLLTDVVPENSEVYVMQALSGG